MPLQLDKPIRDGHWTSGLCECSLDGTACLESFFCLCCQVSTQYNMLTRHRPEIDSLCLCLLMSFGGGPLALMSAISTCHIRQSLRRRYGITGDDCADCAASFFCLPCAISQQYREMTYRQQWPGGICVEPPVGFSPVPMGVMPPPPQHMGAGVVAAPMPVVAQTVVVQHQQGMPPPMYGGGAPPQNFGIPPPPPGAYGYGNAEY